MKRPLCFLCMAYVVTVFVFLSIHPPSFGMVAEEGEYQTYYGLVYHKEIDNDQYILYLKNVQQISEQNKSDINSPNSSLRIICYLDDATMPKIGSKIVVSGKNRNFRTPRNDGEFDEKKYYGMQKISFAVDHAKVKRESKSYWHNKELLFSVRNYLARQFEKCMHEADASVMKAILLGLKKELDVSYKQIFQQSGISHILAISGLHISILGMGFYQICSKLKMPLNIKIVLSILLMLQYGEMVGMTSSAMRAIMMFSLKLGSMYCKRTYDMLSALALTAVTILVEQPLYIFHAGFLLSFSAVLGIGCLYPIWNTKRTLPHNKTISSKMNKIRESLCASISIFLMQLPILLIFFYTFSLYAVFINFLILPLIPILIIIGLICAVLQMCFFFPPLQSLSGFMGEICHIMLWGMEKICRVFISLPRANVILGKPDMLNIFLYYLCLLFLVIYFHICKERRFGTTILSNKLKYFVLLVAIFCLTKQKESGLNIYMLDVGQGDCIFLETNEENHILIDCGSTSKSKVGKYTLIPFLKYHGVTSLDQVFVTHLDEDHLNGILELIYNQEGIRIKCIYIAQAVIRDEKYENLMESCRQNKIRVDYLQAGDVYKENELKLEILHPSGEYVAQETNDYSLVMKLEYQEFHALFTGDVGMDGEMYVKDKLSNWKCHLYKVTHHGSSYSNTQELLNTIHPTFAIISCGKHNNYGHPHKETLMRLEKENAKVYRTDDTGQISIHVNDGKYSVQTYLTF